MRAAAALSVFLGTVLCIASASPAARPAGTRSTAQVLLTFRAVAGNKWSTCVARADGTQRTRFVRVATRRSISRVSWSPNGKHAALIRGDTSTGADLVVADERGRTLRHLIHGFSYPPDDPVWSPDGRWIAVEGGGHGGAIGVVPVRGGGWGAWRDIWHTPDLSSGLNSPTWTPDGRHLAFAVSWFPTQRGESGIYTIGIDGSGFRLLLAGVSMPAYSPDGSHLAYVQPAPGRFSLAEPGDIWVSDADGTNARRLTDSGADSRPAWSPRGRLIAFERTIAGHTIIRAVRPDGSGERVLVSSRRYDATVPSWRPPVPFRGGQRRPCP